MISRRSLIAASPALLLPKRARAVVMMPSTFNLAFPGGRAPGFDPNHVALNGGGVCRFSGINIGKSYVNLLSGLKPDVASSATQKVFNNAMFSVGSGATGFTTGINLVTDTAFIAAAIFYSTSSSAGGIFKFGSISSLNGSGIGYQGLTNSLGMTVANATTSHLTIPINTPFFGVVGRVGTGTNQAIWLCVNLTNGQMQSFVGTDSSAANAPTTVNIGAATIGCSACAYIGGGASSLAMFEAWALDPWSFWYPNRLQDLTQ